MSAYGKNDGGSPDYGGAVHGSRLAEIQATPQAATAVGSRLSFCWHRPDSITIETPKLKEEGGAAE